MDKISETSRKGLGAQGEYWAGAYLENKGYRILECNFKNLIGEIDLVVEKDGTICFVEVKTRRSFKFGLPHEAVNARKRHKLVALAQSYLKYRFQSQDIKARFDVVSIYQDPMGHPHITHVPDAFAAD